MNKARDDHEMWLDSSPTERARLEKQYLLRDSKAVSDQYRCLRRDRTEEVALLFATCAKQGFANPSIG
eukprot:5428534-Amphidinium_carterae.1